MRYSILSLIVVTLFFFGFGINSPGVVFEVETTYHSGSSPRVETSEMSVEGEWLKMEILPSSEEAEEGVEKDEVIFRGDRREMVVVDHRDKSYYVIDEDFGKDMAGELNKAQAEMDKMMKDLPEDVRKQIEEAQKNGANIPGMPGMPTAEEVKRMFTNTGERATKNGYPCVKYEVRSQTGQKIQELWVTDWSNIKGGGEAQAGFRSMAEFFREMMDSFSQMQGGGSNAFKDMNDNFAEMFDEIDGFPVITREFDEEGNLDSESVLRSARLQRLDPAAFEPPSGYKRMSMGPQ